MNYNSKTINGVQYHQTFDMNLTLQKCLLFVSILAINMRKMSQFSSNIKIQDGITKDPRKVLKPKS